MTRGVLLLAYGAPENLDQVEAYYTHIRGGRPPTPELMAELIDRYKTIGGKSPLLGITRKQVAALQDRLGKDYVVAMGMRHSPPWIADAARSLADKSIEEAVAIVLAPHYSSMSVGRYMHALDQAIAESASQLSIRKVLSWHTHPLFLNALSGKIRSAMHKFSPEELQSLHVCFTAHSLPEKVLESGDPYRDQLLETSTLLAQSLELPSWSFAFQSAGRTRDPWLGPDICDEIPRLARAGVKAILVGVVGFLCDHLEVLYDVDVEALQAARDAGVHLERHDMLNDDAGLIDCLADLVREAFQ